LDDIGFSGKSLKLSMESLTVERDGMASQIEEHKSHVEGIKSELEGLKSQLSEDSMPVRSEDEILADIFANDDKIKPIQDEIDKLSKAFDNMAGVDVSELKDKRETLRTDVQYLEIQLNSEKEIERHNKRIEELLAQEKTLAQAIADIEKELFTIEAFEKEKSTRIEASVNNRFNLVKFKLFETQINGGEVPTCKALINGVPFSDANTASKMNAGLDIINTLCGHYGANAPIFIDNRESVIELIPTESQLINLIVSEKDKKLRVEHRVEHLETV
jgi:hypothetical protein